MDFRLFFNLFIFFAFAYKTYNMKSSTPQGNADLKASLALMRMKIFILQIRI